MVSGELIPTKEMILILGPEESSGFCKTELMHVGCCQTRSWMHTFTSSSSNAVTLETAIRLKNCVKTNWKLNLIVRPVSFMLPVGQWSPICFPMGPYFMESTSTGADCNQTKHWTGGMGDGWTDILYFVH